MIVNVKCEPHSEPLMKRLDILKINDQCKLKKVLLHYKFLCNDVPYYLLYFEHNFINYHHDISSHGTCDQWFFLSHEVDMNLCVISHKLHLGDNCKRSTWNDYLVNLFIFIASIHSYSIKLFCNYAKCSIIQSYNEKCSIKIADFVYGWLVKQKVAAAAFHRSLLL